MPASVRLVKAVRDELRSEIKRQTHKLERQIHKVEGRLGTLEGRMDSLEGKVEDVLASGSCGFAPSQ